MDAALMDADVDSDSSEVETLLLQALSSSLHNVPVHFVRSQLQHANTMNMKHCTATHHELRCLQDSQLLAHVVIDSFRFNGFGNIIIAPGSYDFFFIFFHGLCGKGDDRDIFSGSILF